MAWTISSSLITCRSHCFMNTRLYGRYLICHTKVPQGKFHLESVLSISSRNDATFSGHQSYCTETSRSSATSESLKKSDNNSNSRASSVNSDKTTSDQNVSKARDYSASDKNKSSADGSVRNRPAVSFGFSKGSKKNQRPTTTHINQTLGEHSKERRVPGSRVERIVNFGNKSEGNSEGSKTADLGVGLAFGTLSEMAKRSLNKNNGNGEASAILDSNPLLSQDNAKRIVETLCRVRGAALKLGQMMSIQDNSLINPQLQQIFERVRQSADYMPVWQMESVMAKQFGNEWREKFVDFDLTPFAAASIGQVHQAKTPAGLAVAVKIQYPGVQQSINSDINNIMSLLGMWNILPEGLYADSALKVARKELSWECNYLREAKCSQKFREMLGDDPVFYVPEVQTDLTTDQVLTTELVRGVSLDKLVQAEQPTRDFICEHILRLCLSEVFVFNFMQTDPNWSNFLYDKETERISLIDFGASRYFSRKFTDLYIRVIKSAAEGDREGVLKGSRDMGFLTGYESKVMEKAHVDAVMILGEAFAHDAPFDFGSQSTASRIHSLMPIMLKHRLTPPPEETYSLHRKMAGCFLLCSKLRGSISCKKLFDDVYEGYEFNRVDVFEEDLL